MFCLDLSPFFFAYGSPEVTILFHHFGPQHTFAVMLCVRQIMHRICYSLKNAI